MNIREFSEKLLKIYDEVSLEFGATQTKNKLQCPSDCGKCCLNPNIEASVLEMIPMALYLHDNNLVDTYLNKIQYAMETNSFCVAIGNNRCQLYETRPSLCRMFGVSGYLDKKSHTQASICKVLKELFPQDTHKIINAPNEYNLPIMSHWSSRVLTVDPDILTGRMNINLALKKAIEKTELYLAFAERKTVRNFKELSNEC